MDRVRTLNTLRVLLVHDGSTESDSVSDVLTRANHSVLPARGVEEASQALGRHRFDAVLLGSALASDSLARFAAQVRALDSSPGNRQPASRTPILSLSFSLPGAGAGIDAAIPPPFAANEFVAVVNDLSARPADISPQEMEGTPAPVLDVEELRAQVGYDNELMIDIIDIFLADWRSDLAQMRESLGVKDLPKFSRQAHTIKGSLCSLHAESARSRAQALETAGGDLDAASCRRLLPLFASDLETLAPVLQAVRNAPDAF